MILKGTNKPVRSLYDSLDIGRGIDGTVVWKKFLEHNSSRECTEGKFEI